MVLSSNTKNSKQENSYRQNELSKALVHDIEKKYLCLAIVFGVWLVMEMNIVVYGTKTNMVRRHAVWLCMQSEVVCLYEGKCESGELYVCMVFVCDVPVAMNMVYHMVHRIGVYI